MTYMSAVSTIRACDFGLNVRVYSQNDDLLRAFCRSFVDSTTFWALPSGELGLLSLVSPGPAQGRRIEQMPINVFEHP
jgi:hypothetical protein